MKRKVLTVSVLTVLAAVLCTHCAKKSEDASINQEETLTVQNNDSKIVIYQLLVRVFGNRNASLVYNGSREQNGCGRMSDITPEALQSIRRLGCNYVWYTGILQQATKTDWSAYGLPLQNAEVVKGNAGSPYAITDYYAVSADIADSVPTRNEEFKALVRRTHEAGLRVMMDFVPNHVARQYHSVMRPEGVRDLGAGDDPTQAFSLQNNFYYFPGQTFKRGSYTETPAKVTGNDVFGSVTPTEDDWYETVKLNYGVKYLPDGTKEKAWLNADGTVKEIPATWTQMSDILLYWCGMGVDGFRCDVSEMVPVEFWHYGIERVKEKYPNTLFVAEIYNPAAYESYIEEGRFDYLYDKVELYDSIRAVEEGRRDIEAIRNCLKSPTYTNPKTRNHMLTFIENHDEQRFASAYFGKNAKAGIPSLYVSLLLNGNPYLLYFGQELGEASMENEGYNGVDGRTSIFDYWSLETIRTWQAGNWDEHKLPNPYRLLRKRYERALLVAQLPACQGATIDVTTPEMEEANVFCFERRMGEEVLMVVANFGRDSYTFRCKGHTYTIPAHDAIAFEDMKSPL